MQLYCFSLFFPTTPSMHTPHLSNSQPKREGFNKIISDITHSVCPRAPRRKEYLGAVCL